MDLGPRAVPASCATHPLTLDVADGSRGLPADYDLPVAHDPAVLASLEATLEREPTLAPLRLQLASLYLESEEPTPALRHAEIILALDPANLEAIRIAAQAARSLGTTERADGFDRLAQALSGTGGIPSDTVTSDVVEEPPASEAGLPVSEATPSPSDELDDFLAEVLGTGDIERPEITLADVGGLSSVKRRLTTSFLGPMRNPQLREMYGTSLRGGLLLYGPPGCGKTFLARAVAGEMGAKFFGIGLHDVLDMWLGKSEQNLHKIFETARRHAPCVLFVDEVDALGMKRSNLTTSAGRNVVVQLLNELDSTRNDNEGVFFLGATNQPWDVDSALRRPGRFDRMLLVLPPDESARAAILEYQMKGRPLEHDVKMSKLVERTDSFSGADLRLLCESAAQLALEESIESGIARPISGRHLAEALREVKPTTRAWFEMAKNYALFANTSGEYDDLIAYMRRNKLI